MQAAAGHTFASTMPDQQPMFEVKMDLGSANLVSSSFMTPVKQPAAPHR
jgi:hypothetical protein